MPTQKGPGRPDDGLAAEIDSLLKKLPHADPSLANAAPGPGGNPADGAARTRRPVQGGRPGAPVPTGPTLPDRKTIIAVWGRVALAAVFGLALTQWPYARECGWALAGYGAALVAILLAAGWCGFVTWEHRLGLAHLTSIIVFFWGVVLSAEVLLPRLGYSVDTATWRCPAPAPPVAPAQVPLVPPPVESGTEPTTPELQGAVGDSVFVPPPASDSVPS
jgi:hypothetical protein